MKFKKLFSAIVSLAFLSSVILTGNAVEIQD